MKYLIFIACKTDVLLVGKTTITDEMIYKFTDSQINNQLRNALDWWMFDRFALDSDALGNGPSTIFIVPAEDELQHVEDIAIRWAEYKKAHGPIDPAFAGRHLELTFFAKIDQVCVRQFVVDGEGMVVPQEPTINEQKNLYRVFAWSDHDIVDLCHIFVDEAHLDEIEHEVHTTMSHTKGRSFAFTEIEAVNRGHLFIVPVDQCDAALTLIHWWKNNTLHSTKAGEQLLTFLYTHLQSIGHQIRPDDRRYTNLTTSSNQYLINKAFDTYNHGRITRRLVDTIVVHNHRCVSFFDSEGSLMETMDAGYGALQKEYADLLKISNGFNVFRVK